MQKTILVTGGAGFIGSHLCDRLLEGGARVICVDNLLTSTKENIAHFEENENFIFMEHDIVEPIEINEDVHEIYNLACPASPVHYQENPIRTIKTNTTGVLNVLGLAKLKNAKILQASTSEVYGDPEQHPQTEEYKGSVSTIGPRACYDEGKRVAETLFFEYKRMHDLKIKVIRIFNTYGPRMAFNDGRVVSNFIVAALKNENIEFHGDGSQTRSFCYVDDLVDGIVKMMNSEDEVVGPINLGNPKEFTIKQLAEKVIELTNSQSEVISISDFREDDPMRRQPDISKARELLSWEPKVELEDGLNKTIEDFKKRLK